MALHHQGSEWIVEAYGCDPVRLADPATLRTLFDTIVRDLDLHPVAPGQWHQFPAPGGITGLVMLAESHLTVHTFPEHGSLCLNLFCCTPRPAWPWRERLQALLGADRVQCRQIPREYVSPLAGTLGSS